MADTATPVRDDLIQRLDAIIAAHPPKQHGGNGPTRCRENGFIFPCLTVQLARGENTDA
jgi:hypothetical protein